jgi:hypothetical protein
MSADDDIFLKMTIPERVDFILAFNAMKAALELPHHSYERALAVQNAQKHVASVMKTMDEAKLRPMLPVDQDVLP